MTNNNIFFIGAATAAHQVEGNNTHSDVWAMEQMECSNFAEKSLDAVDHYNRYEEDIKFMADAGLNAYRFSIEWARIEPTEGHFDEKEIEHYKKVLEVCHKYKILPIVTMHHFSSPKWLITKGGWEDARVIAYFSRYCKHVTESLGHLMQYICTINEANMGLQIAELSKQFMSQAKESNLQIGINLEQIVQQRERTKQENIDFFGTYSPSVFLSARTKAGDEIIIKAHLAAKQAIKSVNAKLKVGLTLSLHDIQSIDGGERNAEKVWQDEFSHYVPHLKDDDFIGVQNYTRTVIDKNGTVPVSIDAPKTQMGYEIYPAALESVIRKVYSELQIPVMVTENGIAISDDAVRCAFIDKVLVGIESCIKDSIPVLGYLHWSLLDNFEWQKGYGMTFGLIEVDRKTQIRKPKQSLYHLGCKAKEWRSKE